MLRTTLLILLMLVQKKLGMDISELHKKYPTWSFELESVDSMIERGMKAMRDEDPRITEDILRQKIKQQLNPQATHIVRKTGDPNWPKIIPKSFDLRDKFTACADLISDMEDEGPCYADASVAVASIATDKYCIFTNGTQKERLSSEYLVACSSLCTKPPYLSEPFMHVRDVGLPSGAAYHSNTGCIPYTLAPCKHSRRDYRRYAGTKKGRAMHTKGKLKPCYRYMPYDHECPTECTNPKYPKSLQEDLKKFTAYYSLSFNESDIRSEIYTHGPVVTSLSVYDDLFDYKRGIYFKGPHSFYVTSDKYVKLIGWGTENGTDYWLAVNSWSNWGENKVIKIPRGQNYLYIEFILYTGTFDPL